MIKDSDSWSFKGKAIYFHLLCNSDQVLIHDVLEEYGNLRGNDLLRAVYIAHPYYAINSEIAVDILDARSRDSVEEARPAPIDASLFTIGYEGIVLETYLRKLNSNGVRILCDVRRNPVSMKFGFSKNQLRNAVNALSIEYLHITELGIESNKRKNLKSAGDYSELFKEYKLSTLPNQTSALELIERAINESGKVALTCFEASHEQRHRGCVSDAIQMRGISENQIAHL